MPKITKSQVDASRAAVFSAVDDAKKRDSKAGTKINRTEAKVINKALDKYLDDVFKAGQQGVMEPDEAFSSAPGGVGLGIMQTIKKSQFNNASDFNKLWFRAVDLASGDPDIVQSIVD